MYFPPHPVRPLLHVLLPNSMEMRDATPPHQYSHPFLSVRGATVNIILVLLVTLVATAVAFTGSSSFRRPSMARSVQIGTDKMAMKAVAILSSLGFAIAHVNAAQYGILGKAPTAVLQASDVVVVEMTVDAKAGKSRLVQVPVVGPLVLGRIGPQPRQLREGAPKVAHFFPVSSARPICRSRTCLSEASRGHPHRTHPWARPLASLTATWPHTASSMVSSRIPFSARTPRLGLG